MATLDDCTQVHLEMHHGDVEGPTAAQHQSSEADSTQQELLDLM